MNYNFLFSVMFPGLLLPEVIQQSYAVMKVSPSQQNMNSKKDEFQCNRCGKSYKAATSLSRHKRLECGVMPAEMCPICQRRFRHKFVLTSHILCCQQKNNKLSQ